MNITRFYLLSVNDYITALLYFLAELETLNNVHKAAGGEFVYCPFMI